MTALNASTVLKQRDQVIVQKGGDNSILFDMISGYYYELSEVGARIWELCHERRTLADLCEVIEQEYEVSAEVAAEDITNLVSALLEKKLLVTSGNSHAATS